jgi:hypothetical protein
MSAILFSDSEVLSSMAGVPRNKDFAVPFRGRGCDSEVLSSMAGMRKVRAEIVSQTFEDSEVLSSMAGFYTIHYAYSIQFA